MATCARHLRGLLGRRVRADAVHADDFKRFAVDFDGDGRRDVVESVPDLVASTANNLKKEGWIAGQSWGYEVVVPRGFDFMLADRSQMKTMANGKRPASAAPAASRSRARATAPS